MIYKFLAFITDGKGNVFISPSGAMSEREVEINDEYNPVKDSLSLKASIAVPVRNAFLDIVDPLSIVPICPDDSHLYENIRFCLIVAEEKNINQSILSLKTPFSLVIEQYSLHLQQSISPEENVIVSNFFFDLKEKIITSSSTSALDFIDNLSKKNQNIKKLLCPSCGTLSFRESLVSESGLVFQKIECSNNDCKFHIVKKENSPETWKPVLDMWNLLSASNRKE